MDSVRVSSPPIIDMNFSKSIPFSARVRAQIRVDLYNITSAVQWPGPATNIEQLHDVRDGGQHAVERPALRDVDLQDPID